MPPETRLSCPACASSTIKLATDAVYVVYLRCEACFNVWSVPKEEYLKRVKETERGGNER